MGRGRPQDLSFPTSVTIILETSIFQRSKFVFLFASLFLCPKSAKVYTIFPLSTMKIVKIPFSTKQELYVTNHEVTPFLRSQTHHHTTNAKHSIIQGEHQKPIWNLYTENNSQNLGGKSYSKDSANFVQTIKSIKLKLAENIVSFDVEDMYLPLPRAEVLKEVSRLIKLPHFRPKVNKGAFIKLCEICLSQMYSHVEDRYFEQKDGLFIGTPSSTPFGELY